MAMERACRAADAVVLRIPGSPSLGSDRPDGARRSAKRCPVWPGRITPWRIASPSERALAET